MSEPGVLRVVTLNLWGEQGPYARRWPGVLSGLHALAPDVVLLQEVREVPGTVENQARTIGAALGMAAGCFEVTLPWGGGNEGLAILSRWPISDAHHLELPHAHDKERRILLGATTHTPDGDVGLFTSHLNYRLTHGQEREDQIVAAEAVVARHPARVKIWGGDFNATPDSDELRWLRGLRSVDGRRVYYQDAFMLRHPDEAGYTWSSHNPNIGALNWLEPDRRIDYLFVSHMNRDGSGAVREARVVLDQPAPDGTLPSDHYAVFAEIQIAPTRVV